MIDISTIETLRKLKFDLEGAVTRNAGVMVARERFKNALFNHAEELLEAAEEAGRLRDEVDALDAALEDADNELKAIKAQKEAPKIKGKKE